jgi:ATP-dependent Clp protease ATP-binding subunit ClpB
MRFDKLTLKAQEALQEAQALAEKNEQQQVEPEHLLLSLIRQSDGIIPQVFQKLGVPLPPLASRRFTGAGWDRFTCPRD